ncbi:MAG: hypothetical protein QNL94_01345 [Halioglobus sp.]
MWLSKNFFSYKYDYRIEWLEFTAILASGKTDIPENIARALANLAKSPGGVLWSENDAGRFTIAANWNVPTSPADINLSDLPEWLRTNEWIIDL